MIGLRYPANVKPRHLPADEPSLTG